MLENYLKMAIEISTNNHMGQFDKGGNPYIEHPLAVMNRLEKVEEKIVGVLHDVVEDTPVTLDHLRNWGFPEYIVLAVDSVTRREGEEREEFIYRVSLNEIGRKVKIADLLENSDLTRIPNPTEKDFKRTEMYKREILILSEDGWFYKNKKWKKIN